MAEPKAPRRPRRSLIREGSSLDVMRRSSLTNIFFSLLIPMVITITLEWIARGTLAGNAQNNGFWQALVRHFPSFFFSYLLLVFLYVLISQLSGLHALATAVTGLVGNVPAAVTYYKLTMRGEPFLPWDLIQVDDLMGVADNVSFDIQPNMIITLAIFAVLTFITAFVRVPDAATHTARWRGRVITSAISVGCIFVLLFGIFLSPKGTAMIGVREDMWMQDRYYRTNGVVTGFLTNLQVLNIDEPDGYSEEAVLAIAEEALQNAQHAGPLYAESYAASTKAAEQSPNIIFLMAESFWDVTELGGITYDREITPNLNALREEAAYGYVYSPSFGGGTCDVEFEALTGFSMENLPSGSKPYQQYVTEDMFSLPQYLKSQGYDTTAIHGYGARFWNRDMAYPRLGIDTFIASEDFEDPVLRRGFISDYAMVARIIEEMEANDGPQFIHAVTMQNHTTYDPERYPEGELVGITDYPDGISESTIGQLLDCATGILEMDRALGILVEYLRSIDEPTILVFWGDHMNPMSDGYKLFEQTGFIQAGDTASPELYKTPLLIWSNYDNASIDVGTVASYNLSPLLMDLYGIQKPVMFEYLTVQMNAYTARSKGITTNPDGTHTQEMTETQQEYFEKHAILQYDYMFGKGVLDNYVQDRE